MSEQVRPVDEAEATALMQQMTDRNVAAEEDVK